MSRFSKCYCYPADKNRKYEGTNREISRSVMQDLPGLWRATAPDTVNIFGDFFPTKFVAALHHLKSGKALGPDYICP